VIALISYGSVENMESLDMFKHSIQNSYLKRPDQTFAKALPVEQAEAFAPCHITGFFQIFDQSTSALYAGSKGAGVSLDRGVKTIVKIAKTSVDPLQISINGLISNSASVSERVVSDFLLRFDKMRNSKIVIEHQVGVPIGAGFGTSGAAALSSALALNEVFSLGLSKTEAAQVAHVAEVECKTGLGTVIAETVGGLEIRVKPGAPGIGEIRRVPAPEDATVACLVFGPLSTRKVLSDEETRRRVNELGGKLVEKLIEDSGISNFMRLSRQFAEHVGLITDRIRCVLNETDEASFVCSMPMFGESVFAIVERESLGELKKIFLKYGSEQQIVISGIDFEGARLLR